MSKLLKTLNITNFNDLIDSSKNKPVKIYDDFISKKPHLSGVINKNLFGIFDKKDYSSSELTLNFFADKPMKDTDEKITVTVSDKEKQNNFVLFTFDSSSMKLTFNNSSSDLSGISQNDTQSTNSNFISVSDNKSKPISLKFIFDNDSFIVFINNGESTFTGNFKLQKKARSIRIDTTITRGLQFKIIKL